MFTYFKFLLVLLFITEIIFFSEKLLSKIDEISLFCRLPKFNDGIYKLASSLTPALELPIIIFAFLEKLRTLNLKESLI